MGPLLDTTFIIINDCKNKWFIESLRPASSLQVGLYWESRVRLRYRSNMQGKQKKMVDFQVCLLIDSFN
jgi:hypothetical protein